MRSAPRPCWALRVRGLSRRADSALGLPRPPRARARPGDAALLPGRARALLRPRRQPGPSPATHKGWPRARPGDRGGARPPLCSRLRGAVRVGRSLSASWPGGRAETPGRPRHRGGRSARACRVRSGVVVWRWLVLGPESQGRRACVGGHLCLQKLGFWSGWKKVEAAENETRSERGCLHPACPGQFPISPWGRGGCRRFGSWRVLRAVQVIFS